MLSVIARVVLLVALLATLVISSAPAFARGGCYIDEKTGQCINTGCKTGCTTEIFGCACLKF